jgi:lipopolysaccharide transport system permease protein
MKYVRDLYQFRDLLWLWTMREVMVRYKQSLLGIAWAILQPLALTAVFTVVFARLVRIDTGGIPYPVFAYTALVPWTLLATAVTFGIPSLVNNMNLVTKIYFPREILPLASVGAALLDFAIAAVIFVGMMLYYGVWPTPYALWVIPLLAIQIVLMVGVTLLGAAMIVFFRDMRFVVPLVTQVWMYATPIVYPAELVPLRLQPLYYLNPMAGIIDGYRRVLLTAQPPQLNFVLIAAVISVLILVVSYLVFKHVERDFADLI